MKLSPVAVPAAAGRPLAFPSRAERPLAHVVLAAGDRRDGVGRVLAAPYPHHPRDPLAGNQSVGEKMRCWISLR